MTTTTTIAQEILNQLGGNRFTVMTGSKNYIADGNTLRMNLAKNASKANMLYITLNVMDTYDMRFIKYTAGRLNKKTFDWIEDRIEEVETIEGIYNDQLQSVFTRVTGMYTSL